MFQLLRIPDFIFVWIGSFFFLGMTFSDYPFPSFGMVFGLLLGIASVCFFLPPKQALLGKLGICGLFFLLGILFNRIGEKQEGRSWWDTHYSNNNVMHGTIALVKEGRGDWTQYLFRVDYLQTEKGFVSCRQLVLLYARKKEIKWGVGQEMITGVKLEKMQGPAYPGAFDAKNYWARKGIDYLGFVEPQSVLTRNHPETTIHSFFDRTKRKCMRWFDENLPPAESGLMKALVLGDKQGLSSEDLRGFSSAGAMHILAVSGLHVGILFALLVHVLSQFSRWIGKYQAFFIALMILLLYALLTGGSPSIFRAVFMFGLLGYGRVRGGSFQSINLLFFSALLLVLWDRHFLYDLGFQLSYLAVLGILLFYPPLSRLFFFKQKWVQKMWEATVIGLAATLMTFPLTLNVFHQFPAYFLLTNLLLLFVTEILLIGGILFLLFAALGLGLSWFAYLLIGMAKSMLWVVKWISSLPGSTVYGFQLELWILVVLWLVLLGMVYYLRNGVKWKLILVSFSFIVPLSFIHYKRYKITNEQEVIVYGTNTPLISIHTASENLFVYTDSAQWGRFERIAMDYQKMKGNPIRWHYLQENKKMQVHSRDLHLTISNFKQDMDISLNQRDFRLLKKYARNDSVRNTSISLFPPWMKTEEKGIHLKNGAHILTTSTDLSK